MHDLLSTMACHAAVRSGEELPDAELDYLLKEAETVDFAIVLTEDESLSGGKNLKIESWFDGKHLKLLNGKKNIYPSWTHSKW